jgi:hypothetical protein
LQVQALVNQQVILIQPLAPEKPALGEVCNGCGICCLAEPCPLGVLLSLSRKGPCKALVWNDDRRQYRCGAFVDASPAAGPVAGGLGRLRNRVIGRWIGADHGCDCDLDIKGQAQ